MGLAFLSRVTGQLGAPLEKKPLAWSLPRNATGWWSEARGVTPQEASGPSAHPGTWVDAMLHLPTGASSIEIPVLCLLVNGDPSTLEVGQAGVSHRAPQLGPGWRLVLIGPTVPPPPASEDFQGRGARRPVADPGGLGGHRRRARCPREPAPRPGAPGGREAV